ncbi:MAG: hypothetical protein HYV27_16945 [Candidatus Hydrogenedentes bacterium]|nr:hypothetical protein [Candidatus Hydrogenedentota bacterium]
MSSKNNGSNRATTPDATRYPAVSLGQGREEARERKAAFPYRFPRDLRSLGGKYTVKENAERLQRYFYFERRLSHALGSWTLAIPEFEVKLETGRHIFYHMDAAHTLRTRLSEQERGLTIIDNYRNEEIEQLIEEALSAADTPELLVGIHRVIGRALETAYRHHIDDTDPVTDAPTIRALKRILVDYEPMLDWADGAIEAYIAGGIDEARLNTWEWHLKQLLGSIGGVSGADPRGKAPERIRCVEKPYLRGAEPKRDSRFTTFYNTGDYDKADGAPRYPTESYESLRLRFIRTQRDEVDAIEAFGTFLWDIRLKNFQAEYDLARITWDEARHTETGHRAMLASGYDPFELPNRLTGSTCRGPMEPEFAMAEINLFGEVGVLKTIHSLIEKARDENDTLLAHIADFIRSDERTHVKKGQHILRAMTDLDTPDLEQRTRELFTECLVTLGVVTKEFDLFTVSREDLEELVGE